MVLEKSGEAIGESTPLVQPKDENSATATADPARSKAASMHYGRFLVTQLQLDPQTIDIDSLGLSVSQHDKIFDETDAIAQTTEETELLKINSISLREPAAIAENKQESVIEAIQIESKIPIEEIQVKHSLAEPNTLNSDEAQQGLVFVQVSENPQETEKAEPVKSFDVFPLSNIPDFAFDRKESVVSFLTFDLDILFSLPEKKKKKSVRFTLPVRRTSLTSELFPSVSSKGAWNCQQNNKRYSSKKTEDPNLLDIRNWSRNFPHSPRDFQAEEEEGGEEEEEEIEEEKEMKNNAANNMENEDYSFYESRKKGENSARCGLGKWRPHFLQKFATKEMFLLVYFVVRLVQGMFYTYNVSVISTIEKRFHLSSKFLGIFLAGSDFSQILFAVAVSYAGSFGNRPRWLGMGAMIAAIACLMAALPHFLYGPGEEANKIAASFVNASATWTAVTPTEVCTAGSVGPHLCSNYKSEGYSAAFFLLFGSQLLLGVSGSIIFIIGLSFMDDIIQKKESPIYFVIGPTLGFILGSQCLTVWIDPAKNVSLSTKDPRWYGAWWLGFFVLSLGIGFFGFFFFFFPPKLPKCVPQQAVNGQASFRSKRNFISSRLAFASKACRKRKQKPSLKGLCEGLKRLARNKVWMANTFSSFTFVLALGGYWNFKPKYLESQFRKSASTASFYTGVASLAASIFGIGLSGIIFKFWRPKTKFVTAYNVFLSLFAVVAMLVLMQIQCPPINVIGPNSSSQSSSACIANCSCSPKFSPVCAPDGVTTFHSACYVGCSEKHYNASINGFINCSCVNDFKKQGSSFGKVTYSNESIVKEGYCEENCNAFIVYIVLSIITKSIFASGRVGGLLVNIRSIADSDKTLALGCMSVLTSLFGFIPAPIIMGAAIDNSCFIWEKKCNRKGKCAFYDAHSFRTYLHIIPASIMVLSALGDFIVYLNHDKLDLYGEKEEKTSEVVEKAETQKNLC